MYFDLPSHSQVSIYQALIHYVIIICQTTTPSKLQSKTLETGFE